MKGVWATFKKKKLYLEICENPGKSWNFVLTEKWEPCIMLARRVSSIN